MTNLIEERIERACWDLESALAQARLCAHFAESESNGISGASISLLTRALERFGRVATATAESLRSKMEHGSGCVGPHQNKNLGSSPGSISEPGAPGN